MKMTKEEYLVKLEEINNDKDLEGPDYIETVLGCTCEANLTEQEKGLVFTHLVYYMFPTCTCLNNSDMSLSVLIKKL